MKIYEISSFEDIDIEDCLNEFKTSGLFLFRGYDMSHEEQMQIMEIIGDKFAWTPGKEKKVFSRYIENHNRATSDINRSIREDNILIRWHIEHIGLKNPAIGASWNMRTFKCSAEFGNTLFCDGVELYKTTDEKSVDFLKNCEFSWKPQTTNSLEPQILSVIRDHKITGMPMIYTPIINFPGFGEYLHSFAGKKPSEKQKHKFESMISDISNRIETDLSVRIVHKWSQYDVVFVDLTRMYHAVTGGFSEDEREFSGVWAFDDFSSALDNIG